MRVVFIWKLELALTTVNYYMLIRTVESVVNEPFSICHLKVMIYLHVVMRQFITAELAYPLPLITHKHINTMKATLMGVVTLQNGVVYHVTIYYRKSTKSQGFVKVQQFRIRYMVISYSHRWVWLGD